MIGTAEKARTVSMTDLPVTIGQAEIEHDEIGRAGGGEAPSLGSGGGGFDIEAGSNERGPEEALDLRLVVDDQNARQHQETGASGRRRAMRVPRLRMAGLVALMVPPMAVIRPRAMARPSPVPAGRPSPLARR